MDIPLSERLRAALTLPDFDVEAAYRRMAPASRPFSVRDQLSTPRPAAVLILLYPTSESTWAFPLIHRASYPGVHSDQIGLPGGRIESGESAEEAALRETCEEIGICDSITVIGTLTTLYVPPSNFNIQPFVGMMTSQPRWQADPREVAEILETPLADVFDDELKRSDQREFVPGTAFQRPYYWLAGSIVWGATAIILSEFEHRLRAVGITGK